MENYNYTEGLSYDDFANEPPELSLVRVRSEIEGRLSWLESRLVPGQTDLRLESPGQLLVSNNILTRQVFDSIKEFLDAANPVVHGKSVDPSTSALIVRTGLSIIHSLNTLIEEAQEQLMELPPKTRLVYRFLELPTHRQLGIARRLGLLDDIQSSISRKELARRVFKEAGEQNKLRELWDQVSEETRDIQKSENPF